MNRTAKRVLLVLAALCLAALFIAFRHRHQVHGWLHQIKLSLLGKGGSTPTYAAPSLDIGGKTFVDVLGYPPYYLAVTQFDAVLFVTRVNNGGSNLFHLLNLKTGREERIPTIADFGRNIGSAPDGFRDYLEGATPEQVVVASETTVGRHVKTIYQLNLAAGIVETRVVLYYDQNGRITNVYQGPGF